MLPTGPICSRSSHISNEMCELCAEMLVALYMIRTDLLLGALHFCKFSSLRQERFRDLLMSFIADNGLLQVDGVGIELSRL